MGQRKILSNTFEVSKQKLCDWMKLYLYIYEISLTRLWFILTEEEMREKKTFVIFTVFEIFGSNRIFYFHNLNTSSLAINVLLAERVSG